MTCKHCHCRDDEAAKYSECFCLCHSRYSQAEVRKMANEAVRYLASPEGQMKLRQHKEDAAKLVERFREMRRIPHELLHRPFTI